MSIDQKHPEFTFSLTDWTLMRDTFKGERAVKGKNFVYLPPTEGQRADGLGAATQRGQQAYNAYILRAIFPDFVKRATELALGVMHHKPPTIKLPAQMESMRGKATTKGESLNQLLRRINEEQMITGRIGLLADIATDPAAPANVLPYIATYFAESIINWDDGRREQITLQNLNLVVLNESEFERQSDFSWQIEQKYRVLVLGDPVDNEGVFTRGVYRAGVFRDANAAVFDEGNLMTPQVRGQSLDEIPFVFINSKDMVPETDEPPLLGLAKLALAVYRGEADYRQSLFMQGQDTFVVIGTVIGKPDADDGSTDSRVGAGATLNLDTGGDAKYVGVESDGLSEQREALQNDRVEAVKMTGNLLDTKSRDRESGDALKIRRGAQTATLSSIALTGAAGLEKILKQIARWIGANPDEVEVKPNLDFGSEVMSAREIMEFMMGKQLGAPLSLESLHQLMRQRGITDKEFQEELDEIADETPLIDETNTDIDRGVAGSPAGEQEGDSSTT